MVFGSLRRKTKDIGQYYRQRIAQNRGARVVRGAEASALVERAERSSGERHSRSFNAGRAFVGGVRSAHNAVRSDTAQNIRRGGAGFLDLGGLSPGTQQYSYDRVFVFGKPSRSQSHKRRKNKTPQAAAGYFIIPTGQPQRQQTQKRKHKHRSSQRTGSILDNFPSLQ